MALRLLSRAGKGKRLSVILLSFFILSGCQSVETENSLRLPSSDTSEVSLALFMAPQGELEPCGCSIVPLGGMHRAYSVLEAWKDSLPKNRSFLGVGGPLFIERAQKVLSTTPLKAKYLVEALNALGIGFVTLGTSDFSLGEADLKSLTDASNFSWISTNVTLPGTSKLKPFEKFKYSGKEFFITSLVDKPVSGAWTEPAQALKRVWKEVPAHAVILGFLDMADSDSIRKLKAQFPQVHFWVEPTEGVRTAYFEPQGTAGALSLYLHRKGFAHALLKFSGPEKFSNIFSSRWVSKVEDEERQGKANELGLIEKKKTNRLSREEKQRLSEVRQELRLLGALPRVPAKDSLFFDYEFEVASKSFENPQSPVQGILKRYKDEIRRRGIDSLD